MAQKVRAELETEIRRRDERIVEFNRALETAHRERAAAANHAQELRQALDDLKPRMHALEIENATMRGYIDRAQEDDHAREELVTVGDPDGERQLVPKRKHRLFPLHRAEYGGPARASMGDAGFVEGMIPRRNQRPPKHWVNY